MGALSVLELFSIGIGPSSSHTVGPMRAAVRFLKELEERGCLTDLDRLKIELYGSLAATGKGHATDIALLMGLEGETPEGVDPDEIPDRVSRIHSTKSLHLLGRTPFTFDPESDIAFLKEKRLPYHSNAIRMRALDAQEKCLYSQVYYSIGGGFILSHEETQSATSQRPQRFVPYPYRTGEELLAHCTRQSKEIWQIVWENEKALYSENQVREGIARIWQAMSASMERGMKTSGELPGGLGVKRRAPDLLAALEKEKDQLSTDPSLVMDWVSLYALSVNEENAAGSRIVTAPTNGSAGVIPAVLRYAQQFLPGWNEKSVGIFLLTATAMGILFKEGASISAAEMGCQGEIGVSSSMAAAGLTAILGGTASQIENAAEIAMEHHLGMTCDPIGGLVQIPCIERNAMGAIKAITAARLALRGDGTHHVSLDAVIRAMCETGRNMQEIYKETSAGGLAVQISVAEPIC